MTPEERADLLADASAAYVRDLAELERAGCDHRFADWLGALPDPDTDGREHR